jgi:hypothetical protein
LQLNRKGSITVGIFRLLVYAILFFLGYRVLKKFFAPNFGEVDQGPDYRQPGDGFPVHPDDKSDIVEDVDYEEVE